MIHACAMLKNAKRGVQRVRRVFHDAWLLSHSLFVALDNGLMSQRWICLIAAFSLKHCSRSGHWLHSLKILETERQRSEDF